MYINTYNISKLGNLNKSSGNCLILSSLKYLQNQYCYLIDI